MVADNRELCYRGESDVRDELDGKKDSSNAHAFDGSELATDF